MYQIYGLIFAVLMQLGVVGLASRLKSIHFCYSYLLVIFALASLSSWQAFWPVFNYVGLALIPGMIWGAVTSVAFIKCKRQSSSNVVYYRLPVLFILIAVLYAALPDYRYDQWNYHLLVGKQVLRGGPFVEPVISDHIFFTGIYEFLTTIPRFIWDNDIFCHSASNSFSFISLIIFVGALITHITRQRDGGNQWYWWILAAIVFAIPDHEVLFSSKPDPLLICAGLAVFSLVFSDVNNDRLLGFFLVAPVACKITYVHFIGAFGVALVTSGGCRKLNAREFIWGVVAAILVCAPYLIKNQLLFGNMFHPIQAGVFHSSYWDRHFTEYWQYVSRRAQSLTEYFKILVGVPGSFLTHTVWLLLPTMIALFSQLIRRSSNGLSQQRLFVGVFFLGYFILWPLFYHTEIYPRFLYPCLSALIIIMLFELPSLNFNKWFVGLVLLVPIIFNSSIEVRFQRMVTNAAKTADEYYAADRTPFRHYAPSLIINKHRAETFPTANYREKRVLTDTAMGYFLATERLDIMSPDWQRYVSLQTGYEFDVAPVTCLIKVLREFDVRYLWIQTNLSKYITANVQELMQHAEPISSEHQVFFLSDKLINGSDSCSVLNLDGSLE